MEKLDGKRKECRTKEKFFFRVTNSTSQNIKLNFDLLNRRLNFYFSTFELLTRS